MKRETVLALNALNQAFYASVALEWTQSRQTPWPGFARLLELASQPRAGMPATSALRVLDVGAGDGRFAAWLQARAGELPHRQDGHAFDYLGLDASEPLLAYARARALPAQYRFERADFLAQAEALPAGPFELIVLLGVLHHVPSFAARKQLLERLAQRVAAGGSLAFTCWRLDRDPRFASRVRAWAAYNARAARPIPEAELEPGDTLLGWGTPQAGPVRYCHFPDAAETEALIAAAAFQGVRSVSRFHADGRAGTLNEYVLLRRP